MVNSQQLKQHDCPELEKRKGCQAATEDRRPARRSQGDHTLPSFEVACAFEQTNFTIGEVEAMLQRDQADTITSRPIESEAVDKHSFVIDSIVATRKVVGAKNIVRFRLAEDFPHFCLDPIKLLPLRPGWLVKSRSILLGTSESTLHEKPPTRPVTVGRESLDG